MRCGREQETLAARGRAARRRPRSCGCCSTDGADVPPRRGDAAQRLAARHAARPEAVATPAGGGLGGALRHGRGPAWPPASRSTTVDENGATALHHAAIHGDAPAVRELLARGADRRREDPQHHATPLGWAEFGRDEAIVPGGDYAGCISALATAG